MGEMGKLDGIDIAGTCMISLFYVHTSASV
jgi:hypothetical protein